MSAASYSPNGTRVLLKQYRCTSSHFVIPFVVPFQNFSGMAAKILAQLQTRLFVPLGYPLCTIVAHSTLRDSLSRHDVVVIATTRSQATRSWQWGPRERHDERISAVGGESRGAASRAR